MANTGWQVTRQETDQYDFSNPGNPALGVYVYFVTSGGNSGSVFLPNAHYTVANVRKAVQARANLLDEIGALQTQFPG